MLTMFVKLGLEAFDGRDMLLYGSEMLGESLACGADCTALEIGSKTAVGKRCCIMVLCLALPTLAASRAVLDKL